MKVSNAVVGEMKFSKAAEAVVREMKFSKAIVKGSGCETAVAAEGPEGGAVGSAVSGEVPTLAMRRETWLALPQRRRQATAAWGTLGVIWVGRRAEGRRRPIWLRSL